MSPASAITARLAAESAHLQFDSLPRDVVEMARQCLLDWFGVTLLGSAEPLVALLIDEAVERGAQGHIGLIGRAERLGLLDAALINGAASHALDYDDGNKAGGHFTTPVASAVMTLAAHADVSGRDVIAAFVAGYELCARLGYLLQPDHYARGFHPTTTLGTLGAAAACARLLNLDAAQTATALAIAASESAGLIANFGTMTKPLHVGLAARNGLHAARLAARGYTAREDIIEHAYGFARAHSGNFNSAAALAAPANGYFILDNVFKFHAACAGTHATIDAMNALRRQHGLTPDDIESATLHINPLMDKVCNVQAPRTGLEIKFSVRTTAALALAAIDTANPEIFTDALAHRADLIALRDRIRVDLSDASVAQGAVRIELITTSGQRLAVENASNRPAADLDIQRGEIANKFEQLARAVIGELRTRQLRERIDRLQDERRVGDLLQLATAHSHED